MNFRIFFQPTLTYIPKSSICAKPNSRLQKYEIDDNFLRFWFGFIYKYKTAVEMNNFSYISEVIRRDYSTYSGKILEKIFHDLFKATKKYNNIGYYWEKKHRNEIDLVAVNDLEKTITFAEIKLNKDKISLTQLKQKAAALLNKYADYHPDWLALGPEDIETYL